MENFQNIIYIWLFQKHLKKIVFTLNLWMVVYLLYTVYIAPPPKKNILTLKLQLKMYLHHKQNIKTSGISFN